MQSHSLTSKRACVFEMTCELNIHLAVNIQNRSAAARGGLAGFSSKKRPVSDWREHEESASRRISVHFKNAWER
ncbi:MAG: hypothetical protein A3A22_03765 [Candidatus Taylorbacteria bacterium RIFCSPLOWO2_01_FULL_45_34b]|nr:MAG: hypothetical protein A3A22_03765 [Candidatus Taylorbacteria bacterium RIFCSPLOWO2_01_FULL_45_34b]